MKLFYKTILALVFLSSIVANIVLGWMLDFLIPRTEFSSAYNEQKFNELACGMSMLSVENSIGRPLRVDYLNPVDKSYLESKTDSCFIVHQDENAVLCPNLERWLYSKQASQTHSFQYRALTFNDQGRVAGISSYRYQD